MIMRVTGKQQVHTRIYFSLPDETFEVTVWGGPFKSGMKISWSELPCDIRLGFIDESKLDVIAGIECALAMANSRSLYAFLLLVFDIILIPTRRFWNWRYRRTGRAPFNGGSDTDCSFAVDRICQAMGVQLFGKKPASLIAPGDFFSCRLLKTL